MIIVLAVLLCPFMRLHAEQPPLKIGVILPMTGAFATYGSQVRNALESSLKDSLNLQLIYEDEGCEPQKAVMAYKKLREISNAEIIIGPWCGSPQMAVAPMIKRDKTIALLGNSSPVAMWDASGGRAFSLQGSIEQEGTFLAEELNKRGIQSIVITFEENSFSRAHEAAVRKSFKGKVLETIATLESTMGTARSTGLRIKSLNPEAIVVPDAFPLMTGLMKELRNLKLTQPVFSVYSAESVDVLNTVGEEGDGLLYSYPVTDGSEALEYFPRKTGELLSSLAKVCKEDTECFLEKLKEDPKFDSSGLLDPGFVLKTLKGGKFVKVG